MNVIIGKTDLLSQRPILAKEWHPIKNGTLLPSDVSVSSGKKVWWKCEKGHEWQAVIANRSKGVGCPYCANRKILPGFNDLKTLNPALAEEWDYNKNKSLKPEEISVSSGKKVWWKCKEGHEWQAVIASRNAGRGCPCCAGHKPINGVNDLQTVNPQIALEWNYEKNYPILPSDVLPFSSKLFWWKCEKGHEWQSRVADRRNGRRCPECTLVLRSSFPEYALAYYLDKYGISFVHSYHEFGYELDIFIPSLSVAIEYDGYFWHKSKAEQDIEKNKKCAANGIRLYRIREELPSLNDSSIDYIVNNRHSDFSETIEKILYDITGIRMDVNINRDSIDIENLINHLEIKNSLSSISPQIASEWNYEKNENLLPEHVAVSSGKKVWWKCLKGHEWQSTINKRRNGRGCPYCSGKKVLIGYNDLYTTMPQLAEEWNCEKNINLMPTEVSAGMGKKVWWKCKEGHEWQASLYSRKVGNGCPYCAGKVGYKLMNVETGEIFSSFADASRSVGLKRGDSISECCKGKKKTAGGYHWKLLDNT